MRKLLKSFVASIFVILTGCEGCSKSQQESSNAPATPSVLAVDGQDSMPLPALEVTDIQLGQGREAIDGSKVQVLYEGQLTSGKIFDSRQDRENPFAFVLGSGLMITGWDQGIKGMREGGKRKLVIPPHLAYGGRSFGDIIPPNSTLIFDIELIKVE